MVLDSDSVSLKPGERFRLVERKTKGLPPAEDLEQNSGAIGVDQALVCLAA